MLKNKLLKAARGAAAGPKKTYVALTTNTTSASVTLNGSSLTGQAILIYEFDSTTGFNALKFSAAGYLNNWQAAQFNKTGTRLFVKGISYGYFHYAFDRTTGLGARTNAPGGTSGPSTTVCYQFGLRLDGDTIVYPTSTSPYIGAYLLTSSGFGSQVATSPSPAPASTAMSAVDFSPAGDAVVFSTLSTPYVFAYKYPWTGSGDNLTVPSGTAIQDGRTNNSFSFSPSGDWIVMACAAAPYLAAYEWSSSGFGATKYTPASNPGAEGWVKFSPDGTALAVGAGTTLYVYTWNGGSTPFGTRYSVAAGGTISNIAWSPDGLAIIVSLTNTSPFAVAFRWTGSGIGSALANALYPTNSPSSAVITNTPNISRLAVCKA